MAVQPSSKQAASGNAIVTHVCDDIWLPGALALGASLRKTGTQSDLVLMLGQNVSAKWLPGAAKVFDVVHAEEPVTPHPSIERAGADCVTLQLRSWQLPYERVLYMDADMIALQNPDDLFEGSLRSGAISAKEEGTFEDMGSFNGGMFMIKPSSWRFFLLKHMLAGYQRPPEARPGIQTFLNHVFPACGPVSEVLNRLWLWRPNSVGCWSESLDGKHNVFPRDVHGWRLAQVLNGTSKLASLHFSGDWGAQKKPWMKDCMDPSFSTQMDEHDDHRIVNHKAILKLWAKAYHSAKEIAGVSNVPEVDCPAIW